MIAARTRSSRRGLTVAAVLICLIVVTLIGGAVLRVALVQRDVVRAQEQRLQAEWLGEAGAARALACLAADDTYKGETWSIKAAELGLPESAQSRDAPAAAVIAIAIDRAPRDAKRRRIQIRVDLRRDPTRHIRHTKELFFTQTPTTRGDKP